MVSAVRGWVCAVRNLPALEGARADHHGRSGLNASCLPRRAGLSLAVEVDFDHTHKAYDSTKGGCSKGGHNWA